MTTAAKSLQDLMDECQGLVFSLAAKIHKQVPRHVELDDLIAYGQLGLAEAAKDFQPERGVQFSTFAYYRIRGAIYDGLSKMSWTSRARYQQLRNQQLAGEALEADQESAPADKGSAEDHARWLVQAVEKLAVVYLATHSEEGGDASLADPDCPSPAEVVAGREISERLHRLVAELPSEAAALIRHTYFEGLTLQEAGKKLGISKSWASRLHARALEQLARSLKQIGAD